MGAVDEMLVQEKRLAILSSPAAVRLEKRQGEGVQVERDPALFLDLLLTAL